MSHYEPPDSWRLGFALDDTARLFGWLPVARMTSDDEVTVTYRRKHDPDDQIPAMLDELPLGGPDG